MRRGSEEKVGRMEEASAAHSLGEVSEVLEESGFF
jgi:hypothetical protein